ncbi:MAG: HEPN domain-containing protein [Sedimentisphaerales bacterium]|nr:HEPN domain-containing protein [Sedimentisphaerales bacterium]
MNEDTRRLIVYRLDQAEETLNAARELSAAGHYRDAVNRAYYAMFYCGLALLASRGLGASKHSGVLSLFNRHFIKTGEFPPEYGRHLREAFDLRQGSDYREFVQISLEQVQEIISKAEAFLQQTRRAITDLER